MALCSNRLRIEVLGGTFLRDRHEQVAHQDEKLELRAFSIHALSEQELYIGLELDKAGDCSYTCAWLDVSSQQTLFLGELTES